MKKIYLLFFLVFGLYVHAQNPDDIVFIPDVNFKELLLSASATDFSYRIASTETPGVNGTVNSYDIIDVNGDGEIQFSEAQAIKYLSFYGADILSLTGINSFSNLEVLSCQNNTIETLELNNLTNLIYLLFVYNQLESISLNNCPNLRILNCSNNQLTAIDLSDLASLTDIDCSYNQLTSLQLDNFSELIYLECSHNNLNSLNINNSNSIGYLGCHYNQLTYLDASHLKSLIELNCGNNLLFNLNIKNGIDEEVLYFTPNPNLRYICVDENQVANFYPFQIQNLNNCTVNTYCSFVPGGDYYTITGVNRFDNENDGCDSNDLHLYGLKLLISNEEYSGIVIADRSGHYSLPFLEGTHTITPLLENSNYFSVSPQSVTVSFPEMESPFNQDFCINTTSVFHDLEVTVLPITPSRPGFNSTFKILYKNKGTQIQSGSILFTYDDTLMDFVSCSPNSYNQTSNFINMNYLDLMPTEVREFIIILNINSPMDTPPVNGGDDLGFAAIILPIENDEVPIDNHSQIKVTVVNSYDPNDKTCLEGNTISPEMVGEYVHYVIRFENTGTFAAENVVITDVIDTSKFELNTLIPLSSSHDFFTRINGNKVEFIFENINLPFDDENNDGYVAFKIKTKPNLVLGDELTNTANIYFDYNFPIITNTTSTTIEEPLSNQDFDFETSFTIYPNPAKEVLNIKVKNEMEVKSVSIYNTLGQIIMTTINSNNGEINVSNLIAGSYFIKIYTDKVSSTAKFIKQ